MTDSGIFVTVEVHLTPRELRALSLLAEGFANKQIAFRMEISSHGVKRLILSIMTKLGAHSRTEAVTKALRLGLIRLEDIGRETE